MLDVLFVHHILCSLTDQEFELDSAIDPVFAADCLVQTRKNLNQCRPAPTCQPCADESVTSLSSAAVEYRHHLSASA